VRSVPVRVVVLGVEADRAVMVEATEVAVGSEVVLVRPAECLRRAESDSEP